MHRSITYMSVAVAAAGLSTLGFTGVSVSGPAIGAPQAAGTPAWRMASQAVAFPGAQQWVKRYSGPGDQFDEAHSIAVSASGRVFVTGESMGGTTREDYATVAYDAAIGAQLWARRYNGPGNSYDSAYSMAVSPSGDRVFVTGGSTGATSAEDYATVAYNAATGAQLWVKRYNGPGNSLDNATSIKVSPSGGAVFVTGASTGLTLGFEGYDYATIAYNAATGAQLWVKRYNGPGNKFDGAQSVAVTGTRVFVTGQSTGATSAEDYATVAYDAATGAQLWVKRYNGPGNSLDGAYSITASPSGSAVFVTGESVGGSSYSDYATIAYDAATGAQLWARRYNGPGNSYDSASSVATGPAGDAVFVTGYSVGATSKEDYATVAYSAATGAQLWARRYNGPGNSTDRANSVAVSPSGDRVFVTGYSAGTTLSYDYATIAYSG